jgi:hypothetical protein
MMVRAVKCPHEFPTALLGSSLSRRRNERCTLLTS